MNMTKEQLKQIIKEELTNVVNEQGGELDEIFGMFKSKEEPKSDPLEQLKKDIKSYRDTAYRLFQSRSTDAEDMYHKKMIVSQQYKGPASTKSIFKMHPEWKEKLVVSRASHDDKEFAERWAKYKKDKSIFHDYAKFPSGKKLPPIYSIRRN